MRVLSVKKKQKKRSRPIIELLEPRVLYSADLLSGAVDGASSEDPLASVLDDAAQIVHQTPPPDAHIPDLSPGEENDPPTQDDTPAAIALENTDPSPVATRHELVVVDTATPDYQRLIDDILAQSGNDRNLEVVLLDSEQNGIDQLSEILSGYSNLDAVHLISHGEAGIIHIGNDPVNLSNLNSHASQVSDWGSSFNPNADLLIYGCDLAASAQGKLLIDTLAGLTGADVAASDDVTGVQKLGGDWELEYQVGEIDPSSATDLFSHSNWLHTLANASPVNTVPGAQSTNEDTALVFSSANGNLIAIDDPDAASDPVEATLSSTNGTLTLSGTTGLTFTTGDGTADADMTFRGTVTDINNGLKGLTYAPTSNYSGSATLTLSTEDSVLLSTNINSGPVGHYTFDDSGDAGNDSSPTGANDAMVVSGATSAVDGTRGNVLSFDGNDYVQISGHLGNPSSTTLAAWVNLTSADTNGAEVLSLGNYVILRLDQGGKLKGAYNDGSTYQFTEHGTTLAGSGWHHVAYTIDSVGHTQTLYLDGVAVATSNSTTAISWASAGGADSFIGTHGNGSTAYDFTGMIDDARVYDSALSATEIEALAADLSLVDTDTVSISVDAVNDAPTVTNLGGDALAYTEGDGTQVIDQGGDALVADVDSSDFDTGTLTVAFTAGSDNAEDVLAIRNQGTGVGQIGLSGSNVTYQGITIGTFAGGSGGTDLVITLNANADATATSALIHNITYENTDTDSPTTGARTVRYVLTDGNGGTSANYDTTVTVTGANDAPTDITLSSSSVNQSGGTDAVVGSLTTTDADTSDTHTYTLVAGSGDTDNGLFNIVGTDLRADDAAALAAGTYEVRVEADDGHSGTYEKAFTITVVDDVDPSTPVDGNATANSVTEGAAAGTAVGITAQSSDTPASAISYELTDDASGRFQIDAASGVVTVLDGSLLDYESATSHNITVRATDAASNQSSTQVFAISVANAAPTATDDSDTTGENTTLNVGAGGGVLSNDTDPNGFNGNAAVSAVDGAGGNVGSAVAGTNGGSFTVNADGSFAFDPGTDFEDLALGETRDTTVTYTLSDATATDTATLTVTVTGANDASVISGTVTGAVTEGNVGDAPVTATGSISITDADANDNPSFADMASTVGDNGYGFFVLTSGTWTYTLDQSAVQDLDAGDTVNDTITYTATNGSIQTVTITITGAEDAPVLSNAIPDQTVVQDVAFNFTFAANTFADVDSSDTLTYTASLADGNPLPAWLSFDSSTRTFSGTPTNADIGSLNIKVTADDGTSTVSEIFVITVDNTNDAPTGSVTIDNTTPAQGDTLTASNTLADADGMTGATVTYQWQRDGVDISGAIGTTYTTVQADVGKAITVVASYTDDLGTDESKSSTTTAAVTNVNDSPSGVPSITGTVTEDQTLTADTSGISDADGLGAFSYQWLRDGVAISGATTSIYTLGDADVGAKISVEVSYNDNQGTAEGPLTSAQTIAVTNVNDAPVGSGSLTTTMLNDNNGPIKLFGSLGLFDPDNGENDLTLRIVLSNSGAGTLQGGSFSETAPGTGIYIAAGLTVDQANMALDNVVFTPTDNTASSGSFTLDVSVDVDDGESGYQPVLAATTLTINRVNDVPTITGNNLGSIVEDVDPDADTLLETLGTLTITDADQGDASFQAGSVAGTYGTLTIDTLGHWGYAANNTQAVIQHLDAGEHISDVLTITTADGTPYNITITISGSEDAAVIVGTTTGGVTEDGTLTAHGTLGISDIDTHDNPVSFPNVTSIPGDNGYGEFSLTDGTWSYTLANGQSTIQELNGGETLVDTHTFTASNGLTQQITVSILGVSAAPDITAIDLGNVEESGSVTITQADLLSGISDEYGDGVRVENLVVVNGDGTLTDNLDGSWTFTPTTHWNGSVSFEYEIKDGSVVKTIAASLSVVAVNPSTVHVANDSSTNEGASVSVNTVSHSQDQTDRPDNFSEGNDSSEQLSANSGNSEDENIVDVGANGNLPTATPLDVSQASIDAASSLGPVAMNEDVAEFPPIDTSLLASVMAKAPDSDKSVGYKPNFPKSIDLRKLDLSPFHLIDQAPVTMNSPMDNPSFIGGLEAMDRDLEEAMEDSNSRHRQGTEAMAGVSISLSAGFVSWMFRSGTLLGSFLSVAPLWKQLDPLPILGAAGIKKLRAQAQQPIVDGEEDAKVERLFKKDTSA